MSSAFEQAATGAVPATNGTTTATAAAAAKGKQAGRLGGAWPWLDENFKDDTGNKIAVLRVITSNQEGYENPGHLQDRVAFVLHTDDLVDGDRTIEQYDFVSCPIGTNRDMTFKPDNFINHGRLRKYTNKDKTKEYLSGNLKLNEETLRVTVNQNPDKTPDAPNQPDYYLMWNRAEPIELRGFGGRVSLVPKKTVPATEPVPVMTGAIPTDEKGNPVY